MAIRKIRTMGDGILNKVCRPVEEMTPKIQELIDDMLETSMMLMVWDWRHHRWEC